jgi:hypothetical protein
MNSRIDENEPDRHALAVAVWENEGGAPAQDSMDHQYGRWIKRDGSLIIHHVFTGIAAEIQGHSMTGLSQSNATKGMLDRRSEGRRRESRLGTCGSADHGIDGWRS